MQRNQNIELVRIIAAFGLVVFHAQATGADIGYAGLIAFAAISTFFANSSFSVLAARVLIPWAFWSIFYLFWRYAGTGAFFHVGLSPFESILYGTHLWFLPFIFVANLAVSRLKFEHFPLVSSLLAFAMMVATPWWREVQMSFDPPIVQFLHALPAVLLGVALRTRIGMAISALGLAICLYWQVDGVSLPYAVGAGAVIAAMLLPRLPINVEALSAAMFGVYLVHIAALGVMNRITGSDAFITPVFAFVLSALGVWVARKYLPVTRKVLG